MRDARCAMREASYINVAMIKAKLFIVIALVAAVCFAEQPERYLLGAHYYLWYSQGSWQNIDADPLLGPYDSAQSSVIDQHLRWAHQFGINFFGVEWAGKDKEQDRDLREQFLESPELK